MSDDLESQVREAIGLVDAAVLGCPVNKSPRMSFRFCPECGASDRESCGKIDAANHQAVWKLRDALMAKAEAE